MVATTGGVRVGGRGESQAGVMTPGAPIPKMSDKRYPSHHLTALAIQTHSLAAHTSRNTILLAWTFVFNAAGDELKLLKIHATGE